VCACDYVCVCVCEREKVCVKRGSYIYENRPTQETHKRDLQKRLIKKTSPTKETYKDLQKRLIKKSLLCRSIFIDIRTWPCRWPLFPPLDAGVIRVPMVSH